MNNKDLVKFLKKNDIALWETIGKDIVDPVVVTNRLIRHYQWIYFMGNIDDLDLGDTLNKNYKEIFVETLTNNPSFRDEFLNYFFYILKVGFDHDVKKWNKNVIINVLVNNKRLFWFDYVAMYALIGSSYSRLRDMIVNDFRIDESIGIEKKYCIKLLDGIINQKFYDLLKSKIKVERENTCKNMYKIK